MNSHKELDTLLRLQASEKAPYTGVDPYTYAKAMAQIENVVAVVSDISGGKSRIFAGKFASVLGIGGYDSENSIWENEILSKMSKEERNAKFIAELRFFHFLRSKTKATRHDYYLMARLVFNRSDGSECEVLHRMYYIYDPGSDAVRFAICLYGPMSESFRGKSLVVNSVTGIREELTSSSDGRILSRRERQVLTMIEEGMTSAVIADTLHISKHTVSRHRQEILSKLKVRNSVEACRLAKSMGLI